LSKGTILLDALCLIHFVEYPKTRENVTSIF
jgi:hypothetical protein